MGGSGLTRGVSRKNLSGLPDVRVVSGPVDDSANETPGRPLAASLVADLDKVLLAKATPCLKT